MDDLHFISAQLIPDAYSSPRTPTTIETFVQRKIAHPSIVHAAFEVVDSGNLAHLPDLFDSEELACVRVYSGQSLMGIWTKPNYLTAEFLASSVTPYKCADGHTYYPPPLKTTCDLDGKPLTKG